MPRYPTPAVPGHYWAKLIHPSGMPEGEDWKSVDWEIVQVWLNDLYGEIGEPEHFGVHVPGIGPTQWIEDFVWGPKIEDFKS